MYHSTIGISVNTDLLQSTLLKSKIDQEYFVSSCTYFENLNFRLL